MEFQDVLHSPLWLALCAERRDEAKADRVGPDRRVLFWTCECRRDQSGLELRTSMSVLNHRALSS